MPQLSHLLPHITSFLRILNPRSASYPTLEEFATGIALEPMLRQMGMQIEIKDSSTFIQSFQNLKRIHDLLRKQAAEIKLYNVVAEDIDLLKISKDRSVEQICRLFLCCQAVALSGENKQHFIEKMLKLEECVQSELISNLNYLMQKKTLSSEKIVLHKITDLQNENQHLQSIIKEQLSDQEQLKTSISILKERISSYEQIMDEHKQSSVTSPKHSKQHSEKKSLTPTRSTADEIQRYETQICNLQLEIQGYKINQARMLHYKQLSQLFKHKYDQLLLRSSSNQQDKELETLQQTLADKQRLIQSFKLHIKELSAKIQELHNTNIKDSITIKLQNVKITHLEKELEQIKEDKKREQSQSLHREPLSEICPQVNIDVYQLKEENENLLNNIEKSTNKIRALQKELQRYKRQNNRLSSFERENKKLQQILMEYSNARGQQNDILVGCLYQLRMKFDAEVLGISRKSTESKHRGRYDFG